MRISVVIPTFNRSRLLSRTIPALMDQQTDGFSYEVIFISNGSSDDSAAVLSEAAARYPGKLRYFYIDPTGGPSAPRNHGIRAATGSVVIILDDDVLPENDLVLRHAEFHRQHPEPQYAALGRVYVPDSLLDDPMSSFHTFPYHQVEQLDRLSFLYFWTCNVSLKREFMLDAGMFDEIFLYYEDMICGHRLASRGMELRFVSEARGQHLHQLKPSDLPAKARFLGRWLVPFVERVPDRAVKERFGILSTDIGWQLLMKRLLRRAAFRIVDNPVTRGFLRLMGATNGKRSRVSDSFYLLIFRRNLLAGYHQALRERRAGASIHQKQASSQWAEKGHS